MVSLVSTPPAAGFSLRGSIHLFVNAYRGFFTPVMAEALRIAGQGTPVLIVQLLKGGIDQGPDRAMQLGNCLRWVRCGIERCVDTPHLEPAEVAALSELWQFTTIAMAKGRSETIASGEYGLVVLDELGLALKLGLIPEADVLKMLDERPESMDVIITGPEMPESLMERADQITQVRHSVL